MASRGRRLQEAAPAQSIGQLSRATGVAIDTIRFYERIGLLPAPRRTAAGYRMYSAADRQRLEFIRRAQELGFSLQEIGSLLKLSQRGGSVALARELAAGKLAEIRRKLVELERLRKALEPSDHDRLIETVRGAGYRLAHT